MKLSEGIPEKSYIVEEMLLPVSLEKRLEVLGMTKETPVKIINRKGHGILIISVRGTRLALGKNITKNITVRDFNEQ